MRAAVRGPRRAQPERPRGEEFLAALRAAFSQVPGMNITIGQPISHRIDHMLSGTRASIAVKLFGPDLAKLRELGAVVDARLATVPIPPALSALSMAVSVMVCAVLSLM